MAREAERWSAYQRFEIVLRVLRGDDVTEISRQTQVPTDELQRWHRLFLDGGLAALRETQEQPGSAPEPGAEAEAEPRPEISVVIPVYNEAGSLARLHDEITDVLEAGDRPYEILFVDDGSTDDSYEILRCAQDRDPHVRVIRFRRNFGQTAALAAGFDHAWGSIVITLDGDRQNDPADIPTLLERLDQGFDMVCGWRKRRQDPLLSRRVPSRIANSLISLTTGVHLHDYGCTLKAMRSTVVSNIHLYGEMHRFIPAVASWMGVKIDEVVVSHRRREAGRSKYGIGRTLRVLLDLMTVKFMLNYSTRPVQIFGTIGVLLGGAGFLMGCYLVWIKYAYGAPIAARPLLALSILLILGGMQLVSVGLLGELLARIYHETRSRPAYVIRELL